MIGRHRPRRPRSRRCVTSLGFASLALALVLPQTAQAAEFDSDGVKIYYEVQGAGDPVVLIHGLGASSTTNWDIPGITALLAQSYKVIALDCRGHGQSDKPEAAGSYGVNMVEDVVRLLDHLNIREAHVVGYSMGGMITMKLLTLHGRRVRSAVLGGMGWFREGSLAQAFLVASQGYGVAPQACVQELAQLAITEAEVRAIRTPVTVIVGRQDPLKLLFVDPLQQVRPDWPVHVIEGADHITCVGKPEFKRLIQEALAKIPPMKSRRRREISRPRD
jgi:pimeloyl-ACP methyl ester carboxylesterase